MYVLGGNEVTNVDAISGDTTAADSLEALLDGTGGVTLTMNRFFINNSGGSSAFEIFTDTAHALQITSANDGIRIIATGYGVSVSSSLDAVSISSASGKRDLVATGGHILNQTTIATLASQTDFTLTAGSADNDAYNGCVLVVEDAATKVQKCVGVVNDYTGSTKTVTLQTNPGVFTMAVGDLVTVLADRSLKPTVDNRTLDVTTGGGAGLDWANVEGPTTTLNLSGTTVKTATDVEADTQDIQTRLPAALSSGNMKSDVLAISGDTTAADNAELFFEGAFLAGNVNDGAPAAGDFDGNSGLSSSDDFYNKLSLVFTSGVLKGVTAKITGYTGATRNLQFATPFPTAAANGDTFLIIGRIGS